VPVTVPFEYLGHLVTVPVRAGGLEATFIFDTGIGLTLISESLAARAGCPRGSSTFTGRRMSGQAVTVPLGQLTSVSLGTCELVSMPVGIFDMQAMAGLDGIDGFLSLSCFRTTPVTVDYRARLMIIEDEASLAGRAAAGISVAVDVERDGCSTGVLLGIDLPDGRPIRAEVDTGTDVLILNQALAAQAGVDLNGDGVRTTEGRDETGREFTRYFTALAGNVRVTGAPLLTIANPQVMVQQIIYDALVGDAFLRHFTTTYDLANGRMIFTAPR